MILLWAKEKRRHEYLPVPSPKVGLVKAMGSSKEHSMDAMMKTSKVAKHSTLEMGVM